MELNDILKDGMNLDDSCPDREKIIEVAAHTHFVNAKLEDHIHSDEKLWEHYEKNQVVFSEALLNLTNALKSIDFLVKFSIMANTLLVMSSFLLHLKLM